MPGNGCKQGFCGISILLVLALGACSAGGGDDGSDSSAIETAEPRVSVRGQRFCELIGIHRREGRFEGDVYNSWTLNDCPAEQWDGLNLAEFKAEQSPLLVASRGPSFWTADEYVDHSGGYEGLRFIDNIEFGYHSNQLLYPSVTDITVYLNFFFYEFGLDARAEMVFFAGDRVYELISPVGRRYVMRSYSRGVEEALSPDDLPEGLVPPPGWQFRQRTLEQDLRVTDFQGEITALWDNFYNTYYRAEVLEAAIGDRVGVELYNATERTYWLAYLSPQEAAALQVTSPWTATLFQPEADKEFLVRSPDEREAGRYRQAEYFGHTFSHSFEPGLFWMLPSGSGLITQSEVRVYSEHTFTAGSEISFITDPQGVAYLLIKLTAGTAFSIPELPEGWQFSRMSLAEDLRILSGGYRRWIHAADGNQLYQGPVILPVQ